MSAVRALLGGIVDYAGLFPPTSLAMPQAVANYAEYVDSADAWMLGRFVVPVARLDEFAAAVASHRGEPEAAAWRLTALLGVAAVADVARVHAFNEAHGVAARIDVLEGQATSAADIDQLAAAASPAFALFVEIPVGDDPAPLVAALRRHGANAKVRTGGVTPDAIPPADHVVRFFERCAEAGVPFKATAGLHHPIRAEYALTYASDAPRAVMFGYLNVLLAAALLHAGAPVLDARAMLLETDSRSIALDGDTLRWRDYTLTGGQLTAARTAVTSFGSCSFREPVDDLASLGIA